MPTRLLLCLCAIGLVLPCLGDTKVLTTGNALDVRLECAEPILPSSGGPLVRGSLQVSPHPLRPVCDKLRFFVDGELKLATDAASPALLLDTAKLSDGEHVLRIDAEKAGELLISTGPIAVTVANEKGSAVLADVFEMPEQGSPAFAKLHRVPVTQEAIWFSGEEADLERHGFISGKRMYITLNDLIRHIGGRQVWGPNASYIEVARNDTVMRIVPGSSQVKVNNNPVDLGSPVKFRDNRTWVPLRKVCELFFVYVEWSDVENRAYVYAPQPTFGVQLRDYPWTNPVTGAPEGVTAGVLTFRNETDLPIHVRLQGNGFQADWQIRAHTTIGPNFAAPGTYKVTLWATFGEDFEDYITVAAGTHDTYYVTLNSITLQSR